MEKNIENKLIKINTFKENNFAIIQIEDNAGGINEKDLPYIFENGKSFRKKPSSGLGLYIANLVITEKFQGTICTKNGQSGAVFTIHLPLYKKCLN